MPSEDIKAVKARLHGYVAWLEAPDDEGNPYEDFGLDGGEQKSSDLRVLLAHVDKLEGEVEQERSMRIKAAEERGDCFADLSRAERKLATLEEAGTCEGDDSAHILAFLNGLHAHLPEDERPTAWMQFSDDQRGRIKAAWGSMVAALSSPAPVIPTTLPMPEYRYQQEDTSGGSALYQYPGDQVTPGSLFAPVKEEMKPVASFQDRVQPWMMACFGEEISADRLERNDRFIEEAVELLQASDYPLERAHALVDYVYGRPQGDINQEVGGVMITLAAHCLAHGVDMHEAGETELARIWTKVEQIRAKQAAKPRGSALPIAIVALSPPEARREEIARIVDPEAWEEYLLEDGRVDQEVASIFEDAYELSLAKADAILTALKNEEGRDE